MADRMTEYTRYAIYHLPREAGLAEFGARWLGWDVLTGAEPAPLDLDDLPLPLRDLTEGARKYGFHATLKAPFALAPDRDEAGLRLAVAELAAQLAPVALEGLQLGRLGSFLSLVPQGDTAVLQSLAADCVTVLDGFRAPLTKADIARRKPDRLTAQQRAHLQDWGYPHVLEEFRFHMTLSDSLPEDVLAATEAVLARHLLPLLARPYVIGDLCLLGEGPDGRFRLIERFALTGDVTASPAI